MMLRDVLRSKNRKAITIEPEASVSEAIRRLVRHDIGSLPVVDGSGRLVGIFTERDVLHGVDSDCDHFGHARMAEVMTRDPITCDLDCTIHDAMGRMSEHGINQLPVMDGEHVAGVVSVGDLIKLLYQTVEAENRHLLEYVYGPA